MTINGNEGSRQSTVVISDKKSGLPFSKGILASSISVAGIDIVTAHKIALNIQDYFKDHQTRSITLEELRSLAFRFIKDEAGLEYAEKYLLWQSVGKLQKPTIILIGGATGVGKSTVATVLANRLNITRVASTDAIREVMRASVSEKGRMYINRVLPFWGTEKSMNVASFGLKTDRSVLMCHPTKCCCKTG